jgi:uncharacterized protein
MANFHPQSGDLPTEFAVFPLPGALVLPRGQLPLRIFEPRYVAMTEDSLGQGRMFGMIQPDPTAPNTELGPALFRVGCLGRLSSFSESPEGHYLITLTGVIRFDVAVELAMRRGYRRVRGDYSKYLADLELDVQSAGESRDALLSALRDYLTHRGIDANWDGLRRMSEDILVVTLAMLCPFDPAEKQALLEAPTHAERAAALLTLLQMGALGQVTSGGRSVS